MIEQGTEFRMMCHVGVVEKPGRNEERCRDAFRMEDRSDDFVHFSESVIKREVDAAIRQRRPAVNVGDDICKRDWPEVREKIIDVTLELPDIPIDIEIADVWYRFIAYDVIVRKDERRRSHLMQPRNGNWPERSGDERPEEVGAGARGG